MSLSETELASIPEAIEQIASGRMVIVVDDEDRENEGDLIMAARSVTPEAINFMARYGRGLICVPMEEDRLRALDLQPMVHTNTAKLQTHFTVSVDAASRDRHDCALCRESLRRGGAYAA